jgi:DNA-binding MarR family transcriptional regulator
MIAFQDASLSPKAANVSRQLRALPITARGERVLFAILDTRGSQACPIQQKAIAQVIGCAKSTVARELDELEERRLIRRTHTIQRVQVIERASGVRELMQMLKRLRKARPMRLPS